MYYNCICNQFTPNKGSQPKSQRILVEILASALEVPKWGAVIMIRLNERLWTFQVGIKNWNCYILALSLFSNRQPPKNFTVFQGFYNLRVNNLVIFKFSPLMVCCILLKRRARTRQLREKFLENSGDILELQRFRHGNYLGSWRTHGCNYIYPYKEEVLAILNLEASLRTSSQKELRLKKTSTDRLGVSEKGTGRNSS